MLRVGAWRALWPLSGTKELPASTWGRLARLTTAAAIPSQHTQSLCREVAVKSRSGDAVTAADED